MCAWSGGYIYICQGRWVEGRGAFWSFFFFFFECRSCVKVEVDVLVSLSVIVCMIFVDVRQYWTELDPHPCFSPLGAHWLMNTVQICFSVLKLPQLNHFCLLDWTPDSLQTNPPAALFFWYFSSLSFLCVHTYSLGQKSFSYAALSVWNSLFLCAKFEHQTHSHLSKHLWNLASSSCPIDCVCAYTCLVIILFWGCTSGGVYVCTSGQVYVLFVYSNASWKLL